MEGMKTALVTCSRAIDVLFCRYRFRRFRLCPAMIWTVSAIEVATAPSGYHDGVDIGHIGV